MNEVEVTLIIPEEFYTWAMDIARISSKERILAFVVNQATTHGLSCRFWGWDGQSLISGKEKLSWALYYKGTIIHWQIKELMDKLSEGQ